MTSQEQIINPDDYFKDFNPEELEAVKKYLQTNPKDGIKRLERSIYRVNPPSPQEFLDEWLGDEIRESLYDHVIKDFVNIWDPENDYHEACLYGATRTGKSICARLSIVYCIVRLWCLRKPHKYYGLSKISSLAIYLMCFSKIKARQLLLKPIENILKASPKFHQVLFEDRVEPTQEKIGSEKIVWSTADKVGCYDEETEVLTNSGWKRFKDLTKDDLVLNMDNITKEVEWSPIFEYFEASVNENLIHFENKSTDIMVTSNHRMLLETRDDRRIHYTPAKEASTRFEFNIPISKEIKGDISEFVLPGVRQEGRGSRDYKPLSIKYDLWASFMGIYLSEGCCSSAYKLKKKQYLVYITQKKEEIREEIKQLLDKLPWKYGEERFNFVIFSKQLWVYLRKFGKCYQRYIPNDLKKQPACVLKYLWSWLIKGDGHISKDTASEMYWTSSERLKNDIQEILIYMGFRSTASLDHPEKVGKIEFKESWGRNIRFNHYVYRIAKIGNKVASIRCNRMVKKVPYKGKVYCVKSNYGNLCVRRNNKINWCGNSIGFSNDIHICLGASPLDIIGADIIMAIISEINFFLETIGVSEDDVWRVYTDTKDRIKGTVANKYGSMLLLDSSANNRDSIIEDYILNQASKDPKVYYVHYRRWEAVPDRYPDWQRTGKSFPVFIGDNTRAPALVTEEFKKYPGDDRLIIDVPCDAYDAFRKNIYRELKNQAGIPTGAVNIFFPDLSYVEEVLFDDHLENITTPIEAPLKENSEDLIMRQIRHIFMEKDVSGRWIIKRAKSAPRWVRVDLSEVSDRTGVSMCHPEIKDDGTIVTVFDFAFDVRPSKDGINLDAIKEFVTSLYKRYHIRVVGISTDKYQSSFIAQAVKKDEKEYKLISVDLNKTPYLVFKSKVMNEAVKIGYYRNIYNNLRSLIETKDKIEHIKTRKDSQENKDIGYEAKDISDTMAGNTFYMTNELSKYAVQYNYDDINRNIDMMRSIQLKNNNLSHGDKSYLLGTLMNKVQKKAPVIVGGGFK
jgi:hypothetical protein